MNIEDFTSLGVDAMVGVLSQLNEAYRKGQPSVSDEQYDRLREKLVEISPQHPFVTQVESALLDGKGRVSHPNPMLSTDKVYEWSDFYKWLEKTQKLAKELGFQEELMIRFTPKLDGCAGRFDPFGQAKFITRGDGAFGNDFTPFGKRIQFIGNQQKAAIGEVVCDEEYYQRVLKPEDVKHPRNFVAGLISSDEISGLGEKAIKDGAVHFVSYEKMSGTQVFGASELMGMGDKLSEIEMKIISACPYRTDGIVIQVDDDALFAQMGHNNSHHYGQLAKKIAGEAVEVTVNDVVFQVGRTGRLSPIVQIEPTEIDGVIVSNVTAHHAGNVKALNIGKGAILSVLRSGQVIPFIRQVSKPASEENVYVPSACPACDSEVKWMNDYLECTGESCSGKTAAHLQFFTKTLNWDLIGGKAAIKLAESGIDAAGLLTVSQEALIQIGFGAGQSANIIKERERVFTSAIEDAKLLAALGVRMLGQRASRTLLKEREITNVLSFTVDEIANIEGFAQKKAQVIHAGLIQMQPLLDAMLPHFQNIQSSKIEVTQSPITGKSIVFTGAMEKGSRPDMAKHAESLGAKVQSSVSSKTDILVAGLRVGEAKISKAKKHEVTIMSEQDYLAFISQ